MHEAIAKVHAVWKSIVVRILVGNAASTVASCCLISVVRTRVHTIGCAIVVAVYISVTAATNAWELLHWITIAELLAILVTVAVSVGLHLMAATSPWLDLGWVCWAKVLAIDGAITIIIEHGVDATATGPDCVRHARALIVTIRCPIHVSIIVEIATTAKACQLLMGIKRTKLFAIFVPISVCIAVGSSATTQVPRYTFVRVMWAPIHAIWKAVGVAILVWMAATACARRGSVRI
jgi:hypothetical protein